MYSVLDSNGCEIIRGHFVEVGIMQSDCPSNNGGEAWLYWMSGQSLTSEYSYRSETKSQAIAHINVWLGQIGLSLENNQIVDAQ